MGSDALDLDKSGFGYQNVNVYLGPSLGWVKMQVKPQVVITTVGTFNCDPGTSSILVNVVGFVTLNLPSVATWVKEAAYRPATAFDRGIWVKDFGGNAAAFPITVVPFGTDQIDQLSTSFSIAQSHQLLRLYPLNDLTGWFSG